MQLKLMICDKLQCVFIALIYHVYMQINALRLQYMPGTTLQ